MKNIQVIDGADNCAYDVFSILDSDFIKIFPNGQDIEFSEDLFERLGAEEVSSILEPVWKNRLDKKEYYPNKCETDLDAINARAVL